MIAEAPERGLPATVPEAVVRTLLLSDLVDSTRIVEVMGGSRALEIGILHERAARDLLRRFGGREIDKSDGFLMLFEHPQDAVGFALSYHRALAEVSAEVGVQLRARVGVHQGEVYLRENSAEDVARGAKPVEVEGLAKPMTARLAALAKGRQTLLTREVFDLAREAYAGHRSAQGEPRWLAHGNYLFKGVHEAVEVFEVGDPDLAPLKRPPDTPKARRAVVADDEITLGWRPARGIDVPGRAGWRLLERLGEGGFGEVWRAQEEASGERRVFKFCTRASRLRGLQREVTLFRLLKDALEERDDIARLLGWNLDEAPYYVELEDVGGVDLGRWVEAQGGFEEVPMATRLELVAQTAEALSAAHSVGVLHKDVKPQNVLVAEDARGRPRAVLTDFGIGLVTDEKALLARGITVLGMTELSAASAGGATTGSRAYMAPELIAGKPASVQADVYALGVMLYQLVVGDFGRVLATGWRRDVADDLLAEDLEGFVDGSPERRPASAFEVAERLRTLEARRARREAEQRERREAQEARRALVRAQRRRRLSALIAAVSLAVLGVVLVMARQAVEARRVADLRRAQAEELLTFMLGDLRAKLEPMGSLPILGEVGDRAMAYFDSLSEDEITDEELLRRSKALAQIGDVRRAEGDLAAAMEAFRESLRLAEGLAEHAPDDPARLLELGNAHFWVGFVLWEQGDLEGALERFESYLGAARRLVELSHGDPDSRLELAFAHSNIGSVREAMGDPDGALAAFRETLGILEALASSDPARDDWQVQLGVAHNKVGKALEEAGDLEEALESYRADLEIKRRLAERDPSNATWQQLLALSHHFLGYAERPLGRAQTALEHFREAVAILERLTAIDATNADWRHSLAMHLSGAGTALQELGELDAAGEHFRAQRAILESLVAKEPSHVSWRRDLAQAHLRLGSASLERGDAGAAVEAAARGTELLEPLLARTPADRTAHLYAAHLQLLEGRAHQARGSVERSRRAWRLGLERIEPLARGSRHYPFLDAWARVLIYLDRPREARPIVERLCRLGYRNREFLALASERGFACSANDPTKGESSPP